MSTDGFPRRGCGCPADPNEPMIKAHDADCEFFDHQGILDKTFGERPRFDPNLPGKFSKSSDIASDIGFGKFVPVNPPLVPSKAKSAIGVVFSGIVEDALQFDMDLAMCMRTASLVADDSFLTRCVYRRVMSFISFNMKPISSRRFLVFNVCEKTLRLASGEERQAQDVANSIYEFAVSEYGYMFEFGDA